MFKDNTAFITGGTGSIGQAVSDDFIKNECLNVHASTTNIDKIKNLDQKINFINLDLKNISQDQLKENINFEPDFLILNAGLNKDNFILLGHSWGGILGIEYALKYQKKELIRCKKIFTAHNLNQR